MPKANLMAEIVVPGELVSNSPLHINYAYIEGGKTFSSVLALKGPDGKLIPLQGPYNPVEGDFVVGIIVGVRFAGYDIWLNTPYPGFLSVRDCRDKFELGDYLSATIRFVDEVKNISLEEPRLLRGGTVVKFPPVKIPRLIGKKNSMLQLIRSKTGCELVVGRNGNVWIGPGKTVLAIKTLAKIEREAHISGLTDRIDTFLSNNGD
ncbi:MAG: KH domain-containing protein [Candidatus Anstonellales archaeon]